MTKEFPVLILPQKLLRITVWWTVYREMNLKKMLFAKHIPELFISVAIMVSIFFILTVYNKALSILNW